MQDPIQRGKDLIVSVSGVRGTIPAGLDPHNTLEFARAFAASVKGKTVVIGRDSRPTGPALQQIFTGALLAAGKDVLDIGLAPTPTVKAAVALHGDAGVVVSASHNPIAWNGFKFLRKGGFFFGKKENDALLAAIRAGNYNTADVKKFGTVRNVDGSADHIQAVIKALPNVAAIRKRKFRVVVDAAGGAGREALPALLEELGCKVTRLYCDAVPGGTFPRPPEPTPAALKEFGHLVQSEKAAAGFALDPDADRLVTGSPGRGAVHEEYTLPLALFGLAVKTKLKKNSVVVVNLSTSTMIDAAADQLGLRVMRAPVGEANVVAMMQKHKAVFGGEGNGGVIHPGVPSFGRDSLIGAGLILAAMADRNAKNLDDLLATLPALHMLKTKFSLERSLDDVLSRLEKGFVPAVIDRRDGLHFVLQDGAAWMHVRASNTEPILRLIAQAQDARELKHLSRRAGELLEQ